MRCAVVALCLLGCYRDPVPVTPATTRPQVRPSDAIGNSDPLAYLPENSESVIVIDAKAVRASGAWKSIEMMVRPRIEQLFAAFTEHCNFDPISQLRSAAVSIRDSNGKPNFVFVLRGYQRSTVMSCVEAQREQRHLVIDNGVVTMPDEGAFTFADDTTLVAMIGPAATAPALRATLEGGAPLRLAAGLIELTAKVDRYHVWAVVMKDSKAMSAIASIGAQPIGAMIGFNFRDDLQGQLRLRFEQPDQATLVVSNLGTQLGQIQAMFPGVEVAADDVDALVTYQMTDSQIAMIVRLLVP